MEICKNKKYFKDFINIMYFIQKLYIYMFGNITTKMKEEQRKLFLIKLPGYLRPIVSCAVKSQLAFGMPAPLSN